MGPLDENVLRPDCLRATTEGLELSVHTPWYRSLPLSCIARIGVALDHDRIDLANSTVRLGSRNFLVRDLPDLHDVWWYLLDPIEVIADTHLLARSRSYDVTLDVDLHIPYLLAGDSGPVLARTRVTKRVVCG